MNRLCVLIPVFNNQAGLERTCASLVEAEGEFDVLVVDDGSAVPIALYADAAGKRRLQIHRMEQNGGITRALNAGLRLCFELGYAYVGRVDSSDTVHRTRFRRQVEWLDANARCGIIGSNIQFVGLNGKALFEYRAPASHRKIEQRMRAENCLIHSGVTMRASVIAKVGGYRETCMTSEDYDLFLRIIRASEAAIIPEALTCCEYNLAGISVARRRRQQRERLHLQMVYFRAGEWASYYGFLRTCLALLAPHGPVLHFKRAFFGRLA